MGLKVRSPCIASEARTACLPKPISWKALPDSHHIHLAPASGLILFLHMQATGTYISRSLSYTGAEFSIIRVEVDPVFKVNVACCVANP